MLHHYWYVNYPMKFIDVVLAGAHISGCLNMLQGRMLNVNFSLNTFPFTSQSYVLYIYFSWKNPTFLT